MSVKKLLAKRLVKAALMTAIALAVGVGAVFAVSYDYPITAHYFESSSQTGYSNSNARFSKDDIFFPNASRANTIRMFDGSDVVNMGEGADTLHMSSGTDAIVFRGGDASEDGIISFDYSSGDPATVWTNSNVHMKVDQDGSGDYAMEIRSDTVQITADEGDVVIDL